MRQLAIEKSFRIILDTYKRAWEGQKPSLVLKLFVKNAIYQEDPFDERPARGHAEIQRYWQEGASKQRDIKFTYRNLVSNNDGSVWGAEWTAEYTKRQTGERNELRGVLFCQLAKDGKKIKKFWEYWHFRGGEPSFSWREMTAKSSGLSSKRIME